jgi:hypothetical protein
MVDLGATGVVLVGATVVLEVTVELIVVVVTLEVAAELAGIVVDRFCALTAAKAATRSTTTTDAIVAVFIAEC